MWKIFLGIFIVLHGLVHLLYLGQSARFFELQPGMTWPDGSWAFSKILGDGLSRNLVSILLVLATFVFVASGIGEFLNQNWWRQIVVIGAILSSGLYLLFWDGGLQHLDNQGMFAIVINLALVLITIFWKPS